MTPDELAQRRKALGLKQADMADMLDMSVRGYQKLEAGEAPIRGIYGLALDRIELDFAARLGKPELASMSVQSDAMSLADLVRGT